MEAAQDAQAVSGEHALRLPLGLEPPGAKLSWGGCLLGLAQVVAAVVAPVLMPWWAWALLLAVGLGWVWRRQQRRPAAPPEPPAWLLLYPDRLVLQAADGQQIYPLDTTTQVRLVYEGYRGEPRHTGQAGRSYYSGYFNEIQLNDGPSHTFYVPDQATEEALRQQLRHWYTRHVDLHEYRQHEGQLGNRTLLLRPEPDYDEQMQLLRDYGFSLYGRPKP